MFREEAGRGGETKPPSPNYPRQKLSGPGSWFFSAKKWLSQCDTTDTGRWVSNTGRVERLE